MTFGQDLYIIAHAIMKYSILTLAILAAVFLTPQAVFAQENCVTVYGGGVVCGAEIHEPIDTDLGDVNPTVLGGGLLLTSGILLYLSKKVKRNHSQLIS